MNIAAKPLVVIVLVNWNGKVDTLECLDSLHSLEYPNYQVVVVDNASTDGTVEHFHPDYCWVHVIEAGDNLGFVGGNNLGIDYALSILADYILLLNNDTLVSPDFLTKLVEVLESDPGVGMAGPLIYYYKDPGIIWSAGGEVNWKLGDSSMVGLDQVDQGQFGTQPYSVDFLTGCAMLLPVEVIQKVGKLDTRFFAYYEDTEWCIRIAKAGFTLKVVPQAKIWHKISKEARETTPRVHYYMSRNRLLFLKITHAGVSAWFHTLVLDYARFIAVWMIRPKYHGKAKQREAVLRALFDFFTGRFGRMSQWG